MTTTTTSVSTCRHCWQPIIAGAPGLPAWVHTSNHRAGCSGGPLPIAEPVAAAEPSVQSALFDVPTPRPYRGGTR